ncbi:bromodomain adjacent to zinc finger domain protein 2B isoform X3 [Electrophorus electricus]|uniref:bromodomain adjacent to zinc finger domain protein 2B isoform X3 n=1 Tax=Electrophorus electricus TaxID=8005 RepID=UPI0015D00BE5|nr:bromodomain adjacent to zinc finger domain protein 2B isoform X3 [Electrophorus electricus]
MESGERLASPSSTPVSLHTTASSSSTSSSASPASNTKSSLNHVAAASLTACGPLFGVAGSDQPFSVSSVPSVPSAFPVMAHPAFGILSPATGRPEFGSLGPLGVTAALTAHPQLGAFSEWWRAAEAHGRSPAAFFPPFLGLPPLFAPPLQNHEATPYTSKTLSKSSQSCKGVNGAMNGSAVSPSTTKGGVPTSASPSPAPRPPERSRTPGSKPRPRKATHHSNSMGELQDKPSQKLKEKKPRKKQGEGSGMSDSESGSSLDTDSDGVSSSDLDDLGEEEEDDDDDQSKDTEESDSEKEGQRKKNAKGAAPTAGLSEQDSPRPAEARNLREALRRSTPSPPAARPRDRAAQPTSVIQSTGLALNAKPRPLPPMAQSRCHASPQHLSTSPKPPTAAAKPLLSSQQPLPLSLCSSPKPLSVPSPPIPLPLSSSPRPPPLTPSPRAQSLGSACKPKATPMDAASSRKLLENSLSHIADYRLKQSFLLQDQEFTLQVRKQQDVYSSSSKSAALHSSSSSPCSSLLSSLLPHKLTSGRTVPPAARSVPPLPRGLLLPQSLLDLNKANGAIQSAEAPQDTPLALTTKPRPDLPVNLSTGSRKDGPAVTPAPGPPGRPRASRKSKTPKPLEAWKEVSQNHLAQPLADLFHRGAGERGLEFLGGKDSDESADDDDDDDDVDDEEEDEEDSDDSLSESDSNSDSELNGSGSGKRKSPGTTETEGEKTPMKLGKGLSLLAASTNHGLPDISPLNLQVIKPSGVATPTIISSSAGLTYHSPPCSSYSVGTSPGFGKRKRVMNEDDLKIPLEMGWRRETRIKTVGGRLQGDVAYYAPCGKRLRQYPDVVKYLSRYGITDITRDNFSFSAKIRVGDFCEAREGLQGLQWSLLREEEIAPRIRAMEGRRGRPPNAERQQRGAEGEGSASRRRKGRPPNVGHTDFPSPSEAKLLRKLEAQEIARQAAQMKLMRKLEKQALARAAKEARKQQAIMAAEERRKQKEQIKILKQQEKIKRIQQLRMEKELRAQQILEAKRKKREEAANARILEAEKRLKEKELRRQQAVILKHQERERRRQHIMLMKAVEARKKAEERERLKQEKRDEKRLNKERKLELRRLEMEMIRELKKPNEDMCLTDHKPLPEFSRIPGLVLPGQVFSDCLMVVQFLRAFGKVLRMEVSEVPTLGALQEGLLNLGNGMGQVQDLLVRLLSSAVCDPGLPPGHRAKSILGDHLTNIGLNRDNVSEVLQQYMEAHCSHSGQLADITLSLKTKAFQAHTPAQKASVLAFLVNELACSKSVVSEIDKSLDQMTVLRKDECIVEGKLKKLKTIHGKRTGKREGGTGGEEPQVSGTPSTGTKRKRKGGDSDEDEDEEDDSDEAGEDDEEEEEEEVKKGKKIEMCDEDEGDQATSVEELEKQIEKLSKQQNLIKRKLFESSHALRSMAYGQDRYHRRYWVLPQCGGVFIEGLESGEGPEELERERERLRSFEAVRVKEEPEEEMQDGEQGEGPQGEEPQGEEPPGLVKQEEDHPEEVKQEDEQPVNTDQEPRGDGEGGGDRCPSLPKEIQETEPQQPDPASSQTPLLKEPPIASDEGAALCHTSNGCPATVTPATAVPASPTRSTSSPAVPCGAPADPVAAPPPLFGAPPPPFSIPPSLQQQAQLLANDQLLRVLTERSGHWFSLLPRTPCDDSSLTWPASPPQASPQPAGGPHVHARTPPPPCSSHHHFHPPCTSVIDGPGNHAMSQAQLKAIAALMPLPVCGWTGGLTSAGLPACSSPVPMCPLTEGSPSPLLAPSISTSKSGSPAPPADKTLSAPSPAIDLPRNHDHPQPQPIPEDMLTGWWKVMDVEQLQTLLKTLHSRGVRERTLHKQVQKSIDLITQTCSKNREVAVMEVSELDEGQVSVETLQEWCVEEQAMETDIALLQQVEELERKATSASLQVKGWVHPEPQSEREDMVYHEHKPLPKPRPGAESQEERSSEKGLWRRASNPLDIAVTRLAELERHLERRYLRSPLGTTIQIRLDNVGTVTVPAPAPSTSTGGEGGEEEIAPGMKVWRKALSEVRNSSQLAMCLQQLQKSIAWERSIMKVYCQMCRKGDNEDLLLLCDGCDKGCHTYCHKPKISCIPEGDWYCPACISKASGQSPKNKKSQSRMQSSGGGKKSAETGKKGKKQAEAPEEEHSGVGGGGAGGGATGGAGGGASGSTSNNSPKKATTTSGQAKKSSPAPPPGPPATVPPGNNANEGPACVKRAKTARDNNRDLGLCRILLAELERHQDAGPFLTPVNLKSVPGYRKVIKKPMDFSTIREKLVSSQYQNLETFIIDVNLVFDNCEKFNEDNSDIGRAGHNMRKFFEKRWTELLKQTN